MGEIIRDMTHTLQYTTPAGFELMYRDSGNMIQFSFFTIQFFLPTQKITMPKYDKFFFCKPETKTKLFQKQLQYQTLDLYLKKPFIS